MVEAERSTLLALMRRLRWRQRFVAAIDGAATAACIAAFLLIVAVLMVRGGLGLALGRNEIGAVLVAAVALGAARYAVRAVALVDMARAVDRASDTSGPLPRSRSKRPGAAPPRDDCVLAAVTLLDAPAAATPFVGALAAQAVRRARTVSVKRVIAPPEWRRIALALLMTCLLAAVASFAHGGAQRRAPSRNATGMRSSVSGPTPLLSLESEPEEAARAARAAHDSGDLALARVADRFRDLLAVISTGGGDLPSQLDRLDDVIGEADTISGIAARAEKAATAARAALNRGAGEGGKQSGESGALAAALAEGGAAAPARAAQAAARLAASGAGGQAALASAARAAADALANSPATDDAARGRRLEHGPDESANEGRGEPDRRDEPRRRLEHLRRDLENAGNGCRARLEELEELEELEGLEGCRRSAEDGGRALSELHRTGESAQARQRLADAARQLAERLRRDNGAGSAQNRQDMKRFGQAARGQGQSQNPKRASGGASLQGSAGAARGTADRSFSGGNGKEEESGSNSGAAPAPDSAAQPDVGSTSGDDSAEALGVGARGGASADGATAAAAGIGSAPGGPVLGARSETGRRSGRDIGVELSNEPRGGSRAQVINGAAARGFASSHYGRVFTDYSAAMEESLDTADVPPGKRYLVRRYFQLIRPRTAP